MAKLPLFDEVFAALLDFNNGDTDAVERIRELRAELHAASPGLSPGQYPEIDDNAFHKRLQRVRDLYVISDPAAVLHAVGAKGRPLTKAQRFVSAYMQPKTGYNGLLLCHGVGVGKTAAACSVAEMYRGIMSKSALVLTKGSVRNEFVKELGSPDTATYGPTGWTMPITSVGHAYHKVLASIKNPDPERMREIMKSVISKNYTFQGYESFANSAQRAEDAGGVAGLRAEFSDRVIIVDEAHSLRSDDTAKRSSDLLLKILQVCTNIKLLLMTATPMYDQPREIIFLMNLLRANDKRELLDADELFAVDGELTDEKKFREACAGYVSFVRGANPALYPTAIKEHVARGVPPSAWPKFKFDGEAVPKFDTTGMVLVRTELAAEHAELVSSLRSSVTNFDEHTTSLGPVGQASNIAYETAQGLLHGEKGLNAMFSSRVERGVVNFTYREHAARGLSEPLLAKYAPKISKVVHDVTRSEGIQFIYSNWLGGGAIPVALALEERGYVRYGAPPMLTNPSTSRKVVGRYMMLTGRTDLMGGDHQVAAALREVNKKANMHGARIKVVIASRAAMEGVNFRCVRDMHLLDGWWNLSLPLQVVGRAMRLLSHGSLQPEERNVTLHYHAASLPGDREGIDHHMYRVAAVKQHGISRILRILRDESVDCAWNSDSLYQAPTGGSIKLRTSLGKEITLPDGNRDGDAECFFGKCTRPCSHNHLMSPAKLNSKLFQPLADDVDLVRLVIEALFKHKQRLVLKDIVSAMPGVDPELAKLCVKALLERNARMVGPKGRGKFVMYGNHFVIDTTSGEDVIENAVVLDEFVESRNESTTDVVADAIEFARSALGTRRKGFPSATGFPQEDVRRHAIAAVLDRLGLEGIRMAAKDSSLHPHLAEGGFIRKDDAGTDVLVFGTTAEFVLAKATDEVIDVPAAAFSNNVRCEGALTSGGVFKLLGSLRGRNCSTLNSKDVDKAISKLAKITPPSEKSGKCMLLELLMRKNDILKRPGRP